MLRRCLVSRHIHRAGAANLAKSQAKNSPASPFSKPDPDDINRFNSMQTGMVAQKLKRQEEFYEERDRLPPAERLMQQMVADGKYLPNAVEAAGLDIEEQYLEYRRRVAHIRRMASVRFYGWMGGSVGIIFVVGFWACYFFY